MFGKCSNINSLHSLLNCYKNVTCLPWTIYLWKGLYLIGCPLLLQNKLQMYSVTQLQCRWSPNVWKMFANPPGTLTFCPYLSWLNNLNFQLTRMSSYAKNKLQMCSVNQHQCRRRQMFGKCYKFTQFTHFLSVTNNDLSWLNNLFVARFQLISISSNAL